MAEKVNSHAYELPAEFSYSDECRQAVRNVGLLADLKNRPIGSSCVTHILPFYGYFKGWEQTVFNPTSWHLVTYNFL